MEENLGNIDIWNYENLANAVKDNRISLAGANQYMLVKLPNNEIPASTLQTFYEIQLRGYVPIIANAERNIVFKRNPNMLYSIVERGALVQIDASSLAGFNGRSIRRFALRLCKHNLVHLIITATTKSEKRPIRLEHAYKYLQKKISGNYVENLKDNAKHVITNNDFHTLSPIKFK